MFIAFFYLLKMRGFGVSLTEWVALACKEMDWDEEPVYDMQDAMRNAGLALAKLVWWENEEKDGHGDA